METGHSLARAQAAFDGGRYEEARDDLLAHLATAPEDAATLRALSLVSTRLAQPAQAFRYAQQAVRAHPQDGEAHFTLALLYLLHGNYEKGFIEYEWRLFRPDCILPRYAQGTRWDGRELHDEALLLHCEQGFGDNLQFIRFLPQVRERVRTLYLACHPELVRLFSGLEGLAGIVTDGQPVPTCAYHCPLLSLPHLFHVSLAALPRAVPYLPWQPAPLPPRARPRIGLIWRANRASPSARERNIPLAEWRELAALPCDWVSLQRDPDAEEQALLRDEFHAENRGPTFHDFQDTAECLGTLDLVLTVDTSVAHLAGALGRPVWVLLPRWPDWRWLLDRPDSPWYPSATLFGQGSSGSWKEPLAAVHRSLLEFVTAA